MYTKITVCIVLIALFFVQSGLSLECYECFSPQECESPHSVTCDQTSANRTRNAIQPWELYALRNMTSNNFECVFWNHSHHVDFVFTTLMTIEGCINREVDVCGSDSDSNRLITGYRTQCGTCRKNLCNGGVSISAFSVSSITLLASIVVAVMALKELKL